MWRGLKQTSAGLNHCLRWQHDTPIATSTPSARPSSTPPAWTTGETTFPAVRRSGSGWRRISRWGGRRRGLTWRARSCFCVRGMGIGLVGSRLMWMGSGSFALSATNPTTAKIFRSGRVSQTARGSMIAFSLTKTSKSPLHLSYHYFSLISRLPTSYIPTKNPMSIGQAHDDFPRAPVSGCSSALLHARTPCNIRSTTKPLLRTWISSRRKYPSFPAHHTIEAYNP